MNLDGESLWVLEHPRATTFNGKWARPNCDWIARTFDMRMEKRKAEMEGLSATRVISTLLKAGECIRHSI